MSTKPKHRGSPLEDSAAFGKEQETFPPFGTVVTAEWSASGATQTIVHGLGYQYRGAIPIAQSDSSISYTAALVGTSRDLGVDVDQELLVAPSGSHTGTVDLWVF